MAIYTTRDAPRAFAQIARTLDEAPFSRRHALVVGALLAVLVFDHAKPFTLSFVIPGMRAMFGLGAEEASYLAVAGLTGTLLGSLFWGWLADRIGRRAVILWTLAVFSLSTVCGAMQAYWQSVLACLVMGFGVGGQIPAVFALAIELLPARSRARVLLFLALFSALLGYALAAGIAALAYTFFDDMNAWRAMWLAQLFPGVLVLLLRERILPESPRYLAARGRVQEARAAAERILGAAPEQDAAPDRAPETGPVPRLYLRTAVLTAFALAWGIANFGFITWLPTLLMDLGYTGAATSAYLAFTALVTLPGFALTALLLKRRRTVALLSGYGLGGAAGFVGLGAALQWQPHPLVPFGLTAIVFLFVITLGALVTLHAAEAFPAAIRGARSGLIAGAGKLGAVIGPYLVALWLARDVPLLTVNGFLAGTLAVGALLFWLGAERTTRPWRRQATAEGEGR